VESNINPEPIIRGNIDNSAFAKGKNIEAKDRLRLEEIKQEQERQLWA
jgi:hypothetical protein